MMFITVCVVVCCSSGSVARSIWPQMWPVVTGRNYIHATIQLPAFSWWVDVHWNCQLYFTVLANLQGKLPRKSINVHSLKNPNTQRDDSGDLNLLLYFYRIHFHIIFHFVSGICYQDMCLPLESTSCGDFSWKIPISGHHTNLIKPTCKSQASDLCIQLMHY